MWPDWVSNPGPLTYESGTPLTALRSTAEDWVSVDCGTRRLGVLKYRICSAVRYGFSFLE